MKDAYLAGDIGGTKTVLALFTHEHGPHQSSEREVFPSQDYSSLTEIVQTYLTGKSVHIRGAGFGIAGPVSQGRAIVTNLPWIIESSTLSEALEGSPVWLLNDLLSIAHAMPYLSPADLHTLKTGVHQNHGALGVVAPGTGLGEGFLVWDGERYQAHPSEGGHTNFGPATQDELDLLAYLLPKLGHVSWERVCSGIGIPNLYAFWREARQLEEPAWLKEAIAAATDPVPVIVQAGVEGKAEICVKTLELFTTILASEAGNLALKILATGGIFIGGGIPPRILSKIDPQQFQHAFTNKGRFSEILARIPAYVIMKPDTALFGVACHIFEQTEGAVAR